MPVGEDQSLLGILQAYHEASAVPDPRSAVLEGAHLVQVMTYLYISKRYYKSKIHNHRNMVCHDEIIVINISS